MAAHRWGEWRYVSRNLTLVHEHPRYEVDLEDCRDSASTLDWIAQVSQKPWASDATVGALVRALDALLHLQGNLCGCGRDHEIEPRAVLRARR